jgi:hypothetical protein
MKNPEYAGRLGVNDVESQGSVNPEVAAGDAASSRPWRRLRRHDALTHGREQSPQLFIALKFIPGSSSGDELIQKYV